MEKKECPPDKVINPRTRRCVNKSGNIGRKILGEKGECSADKVINPKTRKCVNTSEKKSATLNFTSSKCETMIKWILLSPPFNYLLRE